MAADDRERADKRGGDFQEIRAVSLDRTTTSIRLKADDGLYYSVTLTNYGSGVVVPEADERSGQSGTSDAYIAITGDDTNVYRWSLAKSGQIILHSIDLSPNQSEPTVAGVDILLSSIWYRIGVEVKTGAGGVQIPTLVVGPGQPWVPETGGEVLGIMSAWFVARDCEGLITQFTTEAEFESREATALFSKQ